MNDRFLSLALCTALSAFGACAPVEEPPREAPAAPPAPALRPFEDLPRAESTMPVRERDAPFAEAIELEERTVWKRALSHAARAEEHFVAAQEAHRASDRKTVNEQGREARALFDRALEETALFTEGILAAPGEDDPAVRRIVRARNVWFDRLLWLHKTVSR